MSEQVYDETYCLSTYNYMPAKYFMGSKVLEVNVHSFTNDWLDSAVLPGKTLADKLLLNLLFFLCCFKGWYMVFVSV